MTLESRLKVEGMHCRSCELLLKDSISEIRGVKKVEADSKKGIVTIAVDDATVIEAVKRIIAKEGYKVV